MKLKHIFGRLTAIIEDSSALDIESGVHAMFVPCEGEDFDIIFVDPNSKCKPQALLHEEIHAILNRIGINSTEMSHDVQEIVCEGISTYLLESYNIKSKV